MAGLQAALRAAGVTPFPRDWVTESLLDGDDDRFARAYRDGLDALPVADRRGHLSALTGAVAEAVAARLFDAAGHAIVAQLTEPGSRGVDLLLLTPGERVVAVEVKGSLRSTLPRLRRGAKPQMSVEWLDTMNAAMEEWGLESADLYGAVAAVNLAAAEMRVAVSVDHADWSALTELKALDVVLEEHDRPVTL